MFTDWGPERDLNIEIYERSPSWLHPDEACN
jgi:hypothetical protein